MSAEQLDAALPPPASRPGWLSRLAARLQGWVLANPVAFKELRGRMRGRRAYILITIYTGLLSLAMILMYLATGGGTSPNNTNNIQLIGKALFAAVFFLQLLAVCFVAPSLAAGAIAAEREHQTYELLRATLLSARQLVLGKFASGFLFLLLLLLVGLPLQSVAYLFGGVALEELLIGVLLLVVTAAALLSIGLLFSSLSRRTLVASVLSYGVTLLLVFGLPLLMFMVGLFQSGIGGSFNQLTGYQEAMLMSVLWILICLNPPAAAVGSEVILLENDSLWVMRQTFSNGVALTLPSPWYVYALIYTLLSLFLLWLAVRRVNRLDR